MAITRPDPDHDEDRWVTLGKVSAGQYFVVAVVQAYGHGSGQEVIRIISARKATKKERIFYEKKR